jgi:NADPH:quinone reductase-like Zn-dependent oxidoreductase
MKTLNKTAPMTMQAAAMDRFGGIETLVVRTLPVPQVGPDEVLIRVEAAGIGSWDRGEREGHYADYLGAPAFPYVLGWDGARVIAAIGERVSRCKVGDRVFAVASGDDGVALARRLGADAVVDGRKEDAVAAARGFAPDGFDAGLISSESSHCCPTNQGVRRNTCLMVASEPAPSPVTFSRFPSSSG